jgi:hypothetical protein
VGQSRVTEPHWALKGLIAVYEAAPNWKSLLDVFMNRRRYLLEIFVCKCSWSWDTICLLSVTSLYPCSIVHMYTVRLISPYRPKDLEEDRRHYVSRKAHQTNRDLWVSHSVTRVELRGSMFRRPDGLWSLYRFLCDGEFYSLEIKQPECEAVHTSISWAETQKGVYPYLHILCSPLTRFVTCSVFIWVAKLA